MKTTILLAVCAFLAAGGAAARNAVDLTEWKFRYCGGCDPDTPVKEPKDCFKAAYDDAQWRVVQAPHDWGVEGVFDRKYGCWVGGLPCFGVGWYRTRFKTTAAMAAGRASLEFDGVMSDSKVYVNGACVGGRPFGYASFSFDVTALLAPEGTENVIAVRVDNALWGARWYPGGGLYRPVRIVTTGRTRIAWNGVWVKPSVKRGDTARHARCIGVLDVEVALDGDAEGCEVRKRILGEKGLCVESPRLWDVTAPNLYTARVEVVRAGRVIDACDTVFGFRTAEFRPKEGFFLNGRHLKINGVCLHHDLGPLGAAVDRGSIRRQLRIMREMGANAVRTSHNPPARELLEECDRMGIMVLDEIFDEWRSPKMLMGYSRFFADWWERDLVDWIRRDRNHPCVIAWSVGNEVEEQKTPHAGRELGARLAAVAHREDPFRPVTMGCDSTAVFTNGMMEAMDIYGANYRPDFYKELLERFPGKGVLGTETASMVSSRDTYFYPLPDGFEKRPRPFRKGYLDRQVSSYDIFPQRPHNYHPDVEFFRQDTLPQVYGEFIWTGFDYLGEPAPHPSSRSSYYGAVDLCGFPKDRYYAYQAQWRPEHAMVHLLPHWTWHGREGQRTPVWVYTSGDEAELFVNGKSCGFRKKDKANGVYTLEWNDVSYEPGEIRVVAYRNGRKWAEVCRRTAGRAFGLRVTAEQGAADDAFVYYRIALVDSQGTVVPCEDRELVLSVEGDGELAGACNGDATDMTAFRSSRQRTFRGLMLAVVRRVPGKTHRLCVEGESLPRTLCPSPHAER